MDFNSSYWSGSGTSEWSLHIDDDRADLRHRYVWMGDGRRVMEFEARHIPLTAHHGVLVLDTFRATVEAPEPAGQTLHAVPDTSDDYEGHLVPRLEPHWVVEYLILPEPALAIARDSHAEDVEGYQAFWNETFQLMTIVRELTRPAAFVCSGEPWFVHAVGTSMHWLDRAKFKAA